MIKILVKQLKMKNLENAGVMRKVPKSLIYQPPRRQECQGCIESA